MMTACLWVVNALWLARDTRPPVWDMALHQSYALQYTAGYADHTGAYWERSGNYPPLVHVIIALFFMLLGRTSDVASLSNLPASLLLFWSVYALALDLAGKIAARWACLLAALVPYLMWMSRETILDYWLAAWLGLFLVLLRRTRGFSDRRASLALGVVAALGLLTKWFFAAFAVWPAVYVCGRARPWRLPESARNLSDSVLIAGGLAGAWYLPKLPGLARHFAANMQIGAQEGEPAVLTWQSWIYYFRLLEGYQLLGILFALLLLSAGFVWGKRLLRDGWFLVSALSGGWIVMTMLRTKDPRFTMPLLGPLCIVCGAWLQSWKPSLKGAAAKAALVSLLMLQGYAVHFGVSWLPEEAVIAKGYQGSLQWNWNFFLQHYFHILGPPRREDWQQAAIVRRIAEHARTSGIQPALAVIPDLPRFNAANFLLSARLQKEALQVDHPQSAARGVGSFDDFTYVVMSEGDQGMPWTTTQSRALNQIVVDHPQVFRLLETYRLPNGDGARLYHIASENRDRVQRRT
jgi:4-amino-4-deoxy-L-arabinose transferase-like glycosyltransferase